ncbi:uncharacterized protein Z518_03342 [Rhinocladiella mackenziei CBS 650.93]|uniref:Uncharacterized protein n=1 Tax=Rhinocladiella mackenziei CBS 650.93 TaxID=1442369 RepID=A0A0D2JH41_9EURO|nr:uncharacterized protein Z518_03342 [Rhinocladiella mackenziei CBS 650.93]KIX08685.1 hypothetical protein Z518_03342 [Rhinocladiella mackenziei CBS 650.93]
MNFLALLSSLIFYTEAFKLSFYKNTNCAGEFVGTWVGGEGQGCRQEYSGLAEGVVVQSTGPVDDFTTVQFYSSDDCTPGTEMTRANVGCLTVDQGVVGAYNSFQVVSTNSLAARSSKRRTLGQRRHTFPFPSAAAKTPSTPIVYHGMGISFEGIEYKLHQIHANGYIGILPNEWDDAIHVMNNAELVPDNLVRNLTIREVDERDLLEALCSTFATCIERASETGVAVKDVLNPYVEKTGTTAKAVGKAIFDFLKSPFFTQVAVETAGGLVPAALGGVIQAVVGAQVQGNTNNAQACSQQQDQIDALISIVQSQVSALEAASAKITAQQNDAGDEVFTVTVTVVACGTTLESSCGVPAGFCTS